MTLDDAIDLVRSGGRVMLAVHDSHLSLEYVRGAFWLSINGRTVVIAEDQLRRAYGADNWVAA